jgi:hypothetical protein
MNLSSKVLPQSAQRVEVGVGCYGRAGCYGKVLKESMVPTFSLSLATQNLDGGGAWPD